MILKSLEYALLDLPLTLKADVGTVNKFKNPPGPVPEISFLSKRVVLPLFSVININTSTWVPKFLPSFSLILTRASNRMVTLTASIFESVICLVTDAALVTGAFTPTSVSISLIAGIEVWFAVPKRFLNRILWKLKSASVMLFESAVGFTTGVLSKNTSFKDALL